MPVSSLPPSKKRKVSQSDGKATRIQQLEEGLSAAVNNHTSLNAVVDLLHIAQGAKDPQLCSKSIYALYRVFVSIINSGGLASKGDESAKVVRAWIWEKLSAYTDLLVGLMSDEEKALRISALQILFSLLKHLSTSLSQPSTSSQPQFHVSHFNKIITGLLACPASPRSGSIGRESTKLDPDVRDLFASTWLNAYDDVRWFFLRDSGTFLAKHPTKDHPDVAENLLTLLEQLQAFPSEVSELNEWWVSELGSKPPSARTSKGPQGSTEEEEVEEDEPAGDEDDWRKFFDEPTPSSGKAKSAGPSGRLHKMTVHQSLHSLASHRAVFSRAWLALLPRLSEVAKGDAEKRNALAVKALNVMHRGVMPHLTRPVMIMDWIGSCVDYGGTVGLLALNALFILMRDYNLDYPSFYSRLYAFLDEDLLHHKHRARFFRLTELFLSSSHLPATLLASFIKRLSRLSLTAPPAAIIMIVPFTYNALKHHPALMVMINRVVDPSDVSEKDPFNADEKDPMITNALESSLWELVTHRNHYHSSVSTLAKIFQEAFRKQSYDMEDFLDHTYGTLFESESKRKIKKDPATTLELKQYTFPTADVKSSLAEGELTVKGDIVAELWTF